MGFNQVGRIYQNINILNLSRIKQTIDDKSVKKMNLILFIENEKWISNDITRSLIDQFQQKQDSNCITSTLAFLWILSLHYLDLEEAIIKFLLRQADGTMYLEINDFVIYAKMILLMNITIDELWYVQIWKISSIGKPIYHQRFLDNQIISIF